MHCEEPACVSACFSACFSKAIQKLPQGSVIYDQKLCVGCRCCMMACPFDILRYEDDKGTAISFKMVDLIPFGPHEKN